MTDPISASSNGLAMALIWFPRSLFQFPVKICIKTTKSCMECLWFSMSGQNVTVILVVSFGFNIESWSF